MENQIANRSGVPALLVVTRTNGVFLCAEFEDASAKRFEAMHEDKHSVVGDPKKIDEDGMILTQKSPKERATPGGTATGIDRALQLLREGNEEGARQFAKAAIATTSPDDIIQSLCQKYLAPRTSIMAGNKETLFAGFFLSRRSFFFID